MLAEDRHEVRHGRSRHLAEIDDQGDDFLVIVGPDGRVGTAGGKVRAFDNLVDRVDAEGRFDQVHEFREDDAFHRGKWDGVACWYLDLSKAKETERFQVPSGLFMEPHASRTITDLRVLVAEDNSVNLALCLQFLEDLGLADVATAGDGEAVLARLEADPGEFDLVLMDVRMPRKDGIETTREILSRWKEASDRPRIVAVTAHAFEEERRKCLDAGMDACLTKPLKRRDLESVLRDTAAERWNPPANETGNEGAGDDEAIDWRQFDMIVDAPDSPCVAIFEKFVEGVPGLLARIREAAASGNGEEAGSIAHQLKGSSSSFGFAEFASRMKAIELTAKAGEDVTPFSDEAWETGTATFFAELRERVRQERGI